MLDESFMWQKRHERFPSDKHKKKTDLRQFRDYVLL